MSFSLLIFPFMTKFCFPLKGRFILRNVCNNSFNSPGVPQFIYGGTFMLSKDFVISRNVPAAALLFLTYFIREYATSRSPWMVCDPICLGLNGIHCLSVCTSVISISTPDAFKIIRKKFFSGLLDQKGQLRHLGGRRGSLHFGRQVPCWGPIPSQHVVPHY